MSLPIFFRGLLIEESDILLIIIGHVEPCLCKAAEAEDVAEVKRALADNDVEHLLRLLIADALGDQCQIVVGGNKDIFGLCGKRFENAAHHFGVVVDNGNGQKRAVVGTDRAVVGILLLVILGGGQNTEFHIVPAQLGDILQTDPLEEPLVVCKDFISLDRQPVRVVEVVGVVHDIEDFFAYCHIALVIEGVIGQVVRILLGKLRACADEAGMGKVKLSITDETPQTTEQAINALFLFLFDIIVAVNKNQNGESCCMYAIRIIDLTKRYKDLIAVDNLNLDIQPGELFSLLGVNGAGKTTTIKMLTCLVKPSGGDAFVGGYSIMKQAGQVKQIIGVSPQETAVAPNLSVKENLELICGIYRLTKEKTKTKIRELSEQFALDTVLQRKAGKLSGGWQRRVSIAMALIGEPEILFLDEPTLGLDVIARHELWDGIRSLKGKVTIIMTTHYMEEAEVLSDRIGIMKSGRLLETGTADELKQKAGTDNFEAAFVAIVKEVAL